MKKSFFSKQHQRLITDPMGDQNPGLTSDGVPTNDAAFSNSFPYLAGPF